MTFAGQTSCRPFLGAHAANAWLHDNVGALDAGLPLSAHCREQLGRYNGDGRSWRGMSSPDRQSFSPKRRYGKRSEFNRKHMAKSGRPAMLAEGNFYGKERWRAVS